MFIVHSKFRMLEVHQVVFRRFVVSKTLQHIRADVQPNVLLFPDLIYRYRVKTVDPGTMGLLGFSSGC